ncbi:MAG: glycosyltransferase family 2 protein [Candidatus Bathyarchaeia archaeon]
MSGGKNVSVIIGTRNESQNIAEVVRAYAAVLSRVSKGSELVIVDYSEDDTLNTAVAEAKRHSIRCTPVQIQKPGRGYALRVGVQYAVNSLICLADGDCSHDPKYVPRMLAAYIPGSIVLASRFPPLGWSAEHSFSHYYGNKIAVAAVNLLFRIHVTDVTNGFALMSKESWSKIGLDSNHWSFDTQIITRAAKRGISIIEIPSFEPKRQRGKAKLNIFDAAWRIAGRVFLERLTR